MITKLLGASLIAVLATAAATAQPSLHETHAQVSVPGKTVVAYRPLARVAAATHKCHPDATKAVACEARAQNARMTALAEAKRADETTLSQR